MQKDKTEETNKQDLAGRPHEIREQCISLWTTTTRSPPCFVISVLTFNEV